MSVNLKAAAMLVCFVLVAITAGASENEVAEDIDAVLKEVLEEQFGELESQTYQKKQFYGNVAGVEYKLKKGGRLEDGWTAKVVTALGKLNVDARDDEAEVRAENQSLAGHAFLSLQVTSSRGIEEQDSFGVIIMLTP